MPADEKRVLIVDDDEDLVDVTAHFLESNGYAVSRAYSGAEGVRLAKQDRPHLILMDIMMSERTEGFFAIQEFPAYPRNPGHPDFRGQRDEQPPSRSRHSRFGRLDGSRLVPAKARRHEPPVERIQQRIGAPA